MVSELSVLEAVVNIAPAALSFDFSFTVSLFSFRLFTLAVATLLGTSVQCNAVQYSSSALGSGWTHDSGLYYIVQVYLVY